MPNHLLAAAASGSGKLLPAVVPLLVLILGLDAYCLIDLARAKSVRHMPKWVWVLVILLISVCYPAETAPCRNKSVHRPQIRPRHSPP